MKRILLFGLLAGMLTTGTGCGLFQAIFCYRPCVTRGDCGVCGNDGCASCETCDEGCGPAATCGRPMRGPVYGPRRAVMAECDDGCGDPCADPCGGGCYGRCWHRGPLSCLFALFTPHCWWGDCCGERYWGDFYSDPPDCWDPCDGGGNYTGGGCSTCGGGYANGDYVNSRSGSSARQENIVSETERVVTPAPKPVAAEPHKAPAKSTRRRTTSYSM